MRRTGGKNQNGFTLAEILFSMAAFSMVSLGLLMAGTSLRRNASAVADYSSDHAAQMRISDSIAMDLRRSLSVTLSVPNNISIVIPQYMPTPIPSPSPTSTPTPTPYAPQLNGSGGVYYGQSLANSTVTISYYLQSGSIYRLEGTASPVILADNAADFVFTPSAADNGKVIETTITFRPNFKSSGASADAIAGTTFRNRTLLRNNVNVY